MKKVFQPALAGIMILAAAACQREQAAPDTPESGVKEVTTNFVLNVATNTGATKQAGTTVQTANFRGIRDAKLFAYTTGTPAANPRVLSTEAPADGTAKTFDLGTLYAENSINNGNNAESDSRRVLQLTIPVGTKSVLMYGRAPKAATGMANDKIFGATADNVTTISMTPSETVIAAKNFLATPEIVNQYDATARLMIAVINRILDSSIPETDVEVDGYTGLPALKWSDLGHQYEYNKLGTSSRYPNQNITLSGLGEVLGKCYFDFTYIKEGEYRAGSSNAVKGMIIDMYRVIKASSESDPRDKDEANAKRLALKIIAVANNYISESDGKYLHNSTIEGQFSFDEWNDPDKGFVGAQDLNNYPYGDFGIPEGAAQLGFHYEGESELCTKDEFYYLHPNKPLVNPNMNEFEPRKYLYPAELWYYVNSPIRTTSKNEVSIADYPNGTSNWSGTWSSDWTYPGTVVSGTRGVAVADNINYGVAMLKTTVAWGEDAKVNNYLLDNRKAMTGGSEEDREISLNNANIQLRGVLVGGVNPRMNWQFTRYYTAAQTPAADNDLSFFDGVIYDDKVVSPTVPTPSEMDNYTLVYDNYNSSEADNAQNSVYIALEFENGGDAFWGRDNLIKRGSVFYLVAELKPGESNTTITWPTDHQVPPLGADGKSKKIPRVFIQDFMTSATFHIGQTSLQKAYYSVPDLRSSQMSLGLSVDLQWESGLEFDVTL